LSAAFHTWLIKLISQVPKSDVIHLIAFTTAAPVDLS